MLNIESASGTVGRHSVEFQPSHRDGNDTTPMTHMQISLPVSHEDLVAALWLLVRDGLTPEDLDDDVFAHQMVVDTVLTAGTAELGRVRYEISLMRSGTRDYGLVRRLRQRVTTLYGPAPVPAPRRACRSARTLAGVA